VSFRIMAGAVGQPPFPVEAVVAEEDTYLVLSAETVVRVPREHPLRILHAVHQAKPVAPGAVVVQPGSPLRLLAAVHDLSAELICQEAWIVAALTAIIAEVDTRRICALGMPLLGTVHGRIERQRALTMLAEALHPVPGSLKHLWLIDARDQESAWLQEVVQSRQPR
jgi:hypothetical protein